MKRSGNKSPFRFAASWLSAFITRYILPSVFLLCLGACSQGGKGGGSIPVFPEGTELRDGDLICRLGTSWYSGLFRKKASSAQEYSHIGIILYAGTDSCSVIHTEEDPSSGHGGVALESLSSFLAHSRRAGIYRLHLPDSVLSHFVRAALDYRERQVPFDFAFDSASDAELYCSELVAAALLKADSLLPIRPSTSVAGRRVYSLDDLLLFPGTECIALTN
ncbi:YiiX/YebB-like N1pC/P60 family cysteine hydrolase [Porphyromonas gulae]|uniref:YiiX/YebB-like N1pC/P60 family cysteine hydrolase n=1 Tax=Porphyromonas gulae TaxID=111105 RepID=UPI00052BB483|nr:YiiX/YebB-like N1pC/P60 family cysteine hydrolase [Porphyromonas gulae]KGN91370.1 orthopoxovirus protein, PF05708 family [Porphyromonas gulae]